MRTFFGRVPQSVLYDNDRCLVAKILPDGTRKRAKLFSGLLSHYFIHDRYGRPGKGNDKGAVEGLVGYARRNFMVPVPCFATWDDLNLWLAEQCRKRQADVLRGHSESIRYEQEVFLTQMRSPFTSALAVSSSLRMIAMIATLAGFPTWRRAVYLALRSGLKRMATRAGI